MKHLRLRGRSASPVPSGVEGWQVPNEVPFLSRQDQFDSEHTSLSIVTEDVSESLPTIEGIFIELAALERYLRSLFLLAS